MCNQLIGHLAGPVRFLGVVRRAPESPADAVSVLRCSRCKYWNLFTHSPTEDTDA